MNCRTREEAKKRCAEEDRNRTVVSDHEEGIFRELADRWLANLLVHGASPKTCAVYRNALDAFAARVGDTVIAADVTAEDIVSWRGSLAARGLAASTLDVYLRTVRTWFGWLEKRGVLFVNPATGLVLPRVPRRLMPAPSVADISRLLAAPNVATPYGLRDRALLETAYATGARREELVTINLPAVELINGTLRVVGKGGNERMLPLTYAAVVWIERYLKNARSALLRGKPDESALWIDHHSGRLSSHGIAVIVRKHAAAVELQGVTPHALRRACATHLLQGGAHPLAVKELLGHATVKHLAQYLRLTIAELKTTHACSRPGR